MHWKGELFSSEKSRLVVSSVNLRFCYLIFSDVLRKKGETTQKDEHQKKQAWQG
jgi:hypothetical protein